MIDYIKYTIDGKAYELINNNDGTWSRGLNAPLVAGRYDLLLEIGQNGVLTYIDSKDPRYTFYLEVIGRVERSTDLIKYMPNYSRDSIVYNELFDMENIELDILNNNISEASRNTFIRTANNEKITREENFLRLKGLGTLEQRKSYLLTLHQRDKKLDENTIKEIANTITGSDCIVAFFSADEIDNPHPGYGLLQVQVLSPNNQKDYRYEDILRTLKPLSPGHIKLLVIRFFATWDDINNNFTDWDSVFTNLTDWQTVKDYIPPQE